MPPTRLLSVAFASHQSSTSADAFQPLANCSCNATTDKTNSDAQFFAAAVAEGCYVRGQRFQTSILRLGILRSLPRMARSSSLADLVKSSWKRSQRHAKLPLSGKLVPFAGDLPARTMRTSLWLLSSCLLS